MKKILLVLVCVVYAPLSSLAADKVWYTVKKGDFLYKVAEMYGTTVEELHRLNPKIKNVNLVYEGQKIRLIDRNEIEVKKKRVERLSNEEILIEAQILAEALRLTEERRCAANRCLDQQKQYIYVNPANNSQDSAENYNNKPAEEQPKKEVLSKEETNPSDILSEAEKERKAAEEERKQAEKERKAAEEARKKAEQAYKDKYNQIYVAGKLLGKMPGDIEAMEIAPFGYGGGIEANFQITKYFAIMPMIDATYLSGSNKGVDAEAVGISVKPYFLFQLGVEGNGFQPYFGIAPTYTLSIQDVYVSSTENCNMMKNQVGIGAIAGVNYIYKNFVAGLAFEYNYILPYSKDDTVLHMDLSTSYNIGLHLGYRF